MSRTLLDPTLDIVFKQLLVTEHVLLHDMIECVLDRRVTSCEVLNPELAPDPPEAKRVVLDVRVRLGDGEQVDIEMQAQSYPGLGHRFLLYWANLHASAAPRGGAYAALPRTMSILWLARGIIDSPHFHSVFHVKDEATGIMLSNTLEIHTLNLGAKLAAERPELARWRLFFSYESDEALRSLAMSDPKMALAVDRLEALSQDPRWLSLAEERRIDVQLLAMAQGESHRLGRAEAVGELARAAGMDEETVARLAAMPLAEASAEFARLLRGR